MKLRLLAILLVIVPIVRADQASHRKAANDLLELAGGLALMKAAIDAQMEPMIAKMKESNVPPAVIDDFRAAIRDWVDKDLRLEEMQEKIIVLYVEEFSEEELIAIGQFYRTPAGAKAVKLLPSLMAKAMKTGNESAQAKQEALMQRIREVAKKHGLQN